MARVSAEAPLAHAKREVRARVLARRRARSAEERTTAAELIAAQVLGLVRHESADTVASYLSLPGEPGTGPLTDGLHRLGVRVLLPVLRADNDLDWGELTHGETRTGRRGLSEPTGPALGANAIQAAGLIVCPGICGTPDGHRLGRGGGSYDRTLARALPGSVRCLLLYDDEVVDDVPTEPHDERVDVIATPSRLIRVSPGRAEPHSG